MIIIYHCERYFALSTTIHTAIGAFFIIWCHLFSLSSHGFPEKKKKKDEEPLNCGFKRFLLGPRGPAEVRPAPFT